MNYLKYLAYLPLLVQLVNLIRAAEQSFPRTGSGPEKLAWVTEQFDGVVALAEKSGFITHSLATALREGATAVITVIVQIMNAAGALKPAEV